MGGRPIVPHQLKRIGMRSVRYDHRRDVGDRVIADRRGLDDGCKVDVCEVNAGNVAKALNCPRKFVRIA